MSMQRIMAKAFVKTRLLSAFFSAQYENLGILKKECVDQFPDLSRDWIYRYVDLQAVQYEDL